MTGKRLLSLLLAMLTVLACTAVPAQAITADTPAAAAQKCTCGYNPVVYVAALGSAKIYSNPDTDSEKLLFRPENSMYLSLAKQLILPALKLVVTKDYDEFGDKLTSTLNELIGDLAMDDNGDSLPYVSAKGSEIPTDPAHGQYLSYYFGYDFRADPFVTAQKLHDFLEGVKQLTGHDELNLRASSMGGVMMMTYMKLYGYEGIDSLIFQCCPILGTEVAGELLTKKATVNEEALIAYAEKALPELENAKAEKVLAVLIRVLEKMKVFSALTKLANKLIDELYDKVYDDFLVPVLGKMPGIWSFVTHNEYENSKAMALDPVKNAKLIKRLDDYHYGVQQNAAAILNGAKNAGVRVMIVAGYNMQRTPLVESYKSNSDATVDTCYASVGGTVAQRGSTLGEGYIQKIQDGHNHLSPDGVIDASSCVLPENTWFIRDMMHSSTHEGHMELYKWFFASDEDYTVFSNNQYPQFLQDDKQNRVLKIITA